MQFVNVGMVGIPELTSLLSRAQTGVQGRGKETEYGHAFRVRMHTGLQVNRCG